MSHFLSFTQNRKSTTKTLLAAEKGWAINWCLTNKDNINYHY